MVIVRLKRDPYIPIAVLKAFLKIGATLLPESEMIYFQDLITFICEKNHSKNTLKNYPIIHTFTPDNPGKPLIVALILRRKANVTDYPYMWIILSYGNEAFQFPLISINDKEITKQPFNMPIFPVANNPKEALYGEQKQTILHLTGSEVIKDEIFKISLGYRELKKTTTKSDEGWKD